jgi:diguanylate cyclase (GGDEF)-like protein
VRRERQANPARRLFLGFAALSLVPVLLIGLLLVSALSREAVRRGVANGSDEAALIAQTAIEPTLPEGDLRGGISPATHASLEHVVREAIRSGRVVRLRIRDLDGRVVFSDDGSGLTGPVEDEVLEAARGRAVADLTRLNSDPDDTGPAQERVVEVYRPLVVGAAEQRVGVLEVYLPYAPIAADIDGGLHKLYVDLGGGLAVLYLILALISWVSTRRLRGMADVNAHLASHDQLTGLPNRRRFLDTVADWIDDGEPGTVGVVAVLDLDNFGAVNDSLGHELGDRLLVSIAERLSRAANADEVIARLGGDEFGLVMSGLPDAESAAAELARLHSEVAARPVDLDGVPITVDLSTGWTVIEAGEDPSSVLHRAGLATSVAKTTHDVLTCWTPSLETLDPAQLALVSDLPRALAHDELLLHLQPQVRLHDRRVVGIEALVRWQHPHRGLVFPDGFLPLTERTSHMRQLTGWVLAAGLREIDALEQLGFPVNVAVNVSARDVIGAGFASDVLSAVAAAGIDPRRLTVEVTETALLADPERAAAALGQIHAAGVRTSLDDFGQGQTSLSYLAALPIDEIKIDRAFVTDMATNHAHDAIVRAVVDLAHGLGSTVVAEGAEDEETIELLALRGVDIVQGYAIARPAPREVLHAWLGEPLFGTPPRALHR